MEKLAGKFTGLIVELGHTARETRIRCGHCETPLAVSGARVTVALDKGTMVDVYDVPVLVSPAKFNVVE